MIVVERSDLAIAAGVREHGQHLQLQMFGVFAGVFNPIDRCVDHWRVSSENVNEPDDQAR